MEGLGICGKSDGEENGQEAWRQDQEINVKERKRESVLEMLERKSVGK